MVGVGGNDIVYFTSAGFIWLFCQYLCVCVCKCGQQGIQNTTIGKIYYF